MESVIRQCPTACSHETIRSQNSCPSPESSHWHSEDHAKQSRTFLCRPRQIANRRREIRRNPVRSIRFRNCLGMIWSVSTFTRSRGTACPVWVRKRLHSQVMSPIPQFVSANFQLRISVKCPAIAAAAAIIGTDQMRASSAALAAFEIAVAGGSAALAGLQDVGIHPQAHRASRLAPFKTSLQENAVQSFLLRGVL